MRLLTRPEGLSVFTDENNTSKVKWGQFFDACRKTCSQRGSNMYVYGIAC